MGVQRRPVTGEMPGMGKIGRGQNLGLWENSGKSQDGDRRRRELGKTGLEADRDPES